MTVKINMIQKSFFISFLLIVVLIASLFINIPFKRIIQTADILILLIISVVQLLEFIRIKKLLIKTSDILSQGNERDFSVLKEKEKNIINYKITNLIEQLEDSVKQSNTILEEKELLEKEVREYKSSIENIQNGISKDVVEVKRQITNSVAVIDKMLIDFSILKSSCDTEDDLLNNLLDVYSSFEKDFSKINHSIDKSKNISDKEINRSGLLIDTISNLYDKSESNDEQLKTIFKGIDNIREVTDIINEVAEKASILSLNASIESAHAGEAGKGFAVVAEEVGVLADSTSEHAENINEALYSVSDLISDSQSNDEDGINSYPELISDVKSINQAFIKIKDLLDTLSFMKKPQPIDIKDIKTKDKNILTSNINSLRSMKKDLDTSIEKVGQLSLLKTYFENKKELESPMYFLETSVKPVDSEDPIDL